MFETRKNRTVAQGRKILARDGQRGDTTPCPLAVPARGPLLLEEEEVIAVAVALRAAAAGVSGIEETAVRALAKLERVLPDRLRGQVSALQDTTASLAWFPHGPRVEPTTLAVLAAACRDHEIVTFDYTTRDDTQTSRRVEPHGLVASGGL